MHKTFIVVMEVLCWFVKISHRKRIVCFGDTHNMFYLRPVSNDELYITRVCCITLLNQSSHYDQAGQGKLKTYSAVKSGSGFTSSVSFNIRRTLLKQRVPLTNTFRET